MNVFRQMLNIFLRFVCAQMRYYTVLHWGSELVIFFFTNGLDVCKLSLMFLGLILGEKWRFLFNRIIFEPLELPLCITFYLIRCSLPSGTVRKSLWECNAREHIFPYLNNFDDTLYFFRPKSIFVGLIFLMLNILCGF